MDKQYSFKSLLSLRNRYIPALLIIAIFSGWTNYNQKKIMSTIEEDSKIINISGRQRMLSQKLILLCNDYLKEPTQKNKQTLKETILLMKDSHQYLLNHIYNEQLKQIYFTENLDKNLTNYLKKIAKIYSFKDDLLLQELREDSKSLLIQLDSAVKEYENYSESKLENLNKTTQNIFYLTILVLLLEAFFIFYPASKKIKELNSDLNQKINSKTKELQKYLDIINEHILISTTDLKGVITYANEAFCKTSGYSKGELEGQPHNIIRHPDMSKDDFKQMWETIQAGKVWHGKVKNRKKNGDYYWVDAVIKPNYDSNGNIDSYNAVRINITDNVKLEELTHYQETIIDAQIKVAIAERDKAREYAKAKGEFLANMSHEIRTPLNAILGFVDILKEENINKRSLEYVMIISKSSHALLKIIEDILDFSKIESGKLNIDKIYFDPTEEFKIITDLFGGKCSQNKISLNVNIDNNIPKSIKSDPLRIKQVISNLMSNAIKFTEPGKNINVNISHNDDKLKVSVKDEGKGIAHNKLEHIFEAFNQEDNSTTRDYGGTGLGLAISNELIKLLGGELKVKSTLEKGSEFYFWIPAKIGSKVITNDSVKEDQIFNNEKILVVEDNRSNQMLMKIILKKMNLSFEFANDGLEAVELYKNNQYGAILMDENMPNMNGIEATKHILKYEKQNNLQHTPIIALTANALKGDRERFLDSGMDEYMSKPVNKQQLSEILKTLLH